LPHTIIAVFTHIVNIRDSWRW